MSRQTGFGPPRDRGPVQRRCACGCGAYASWGFPGDLWYAWKHIPAALLTPPAPITAFGPDLRQPRPAPLPSAPDLFEAAPMDRGFRPT